MKKVLFLLLATLSLNTIAQSPYAVFGHKGVAFDVEKPEPARMEVVNYDSLVPIAKFKYEPATKQIFIYNLEGDVIAQRQIEYNDFLRWLSVDPHEKRFPNHTPYNFVEGNPIYMVDPKGLSASPVYDKEGKLLGTDDKGFSGEIIVFDDPSKFKQGMSHDEAIQEGTIFSQNTPITEQAKINILHNVISNTEFPNGKVLGPNEFKVTVNEDITANGRYKGIERGKHLMNLDIGDFQWTVENVRAESTHEIYGHGIKEYGDDSNNHHKAYFSSIDSKYWPKTTDRYKSHTVEYMWRFYYNEVGNKPLPLKYNAEYIMHNKK